MTCNATGKPDPPQDLRWYKDGVEIWSDSNSGVIITKKVDSKMLVSLLVIEHVSMSDEGEYECRSTEHDSDKIAIKVTEGQ